MTNQIDQNTSSTDQWVVDSPAVGTDLRPRPCGESLRPAMPDLSGRPLAVTLSGGGFRATLAGAGVLRLLADAGLLGDVRFLSSVSGGSVTNGIVAVAGRDCATAGSPRRCHDHVIEPLVGKVSGRSLKWSLAAGVWRTLGPMNRTELLARRFDEWFFDEAELEGLDAQVRWIINAANLTNGVRFGFERDVVGDYSSGLASTNGTGLRVSTAAAASAAVPGAFAPLELKKPTLPCARFTPSYGRRHLRQHRARGPGQRPLQGRLPREPQRRWPAARRWLRPGARRTGPGTGQLAALPAEHDAADPGDGAAVPARGGRRRPARCPPGARRGVLTALATEFPRRVPAAGASGAPGSPSTAATTAPTSPTCPRSSTSSTSDCAGVSSTGGGG